MITMQCQAHIDELEKSIISLCKHKLKLMKELSETNETIAFLRKQQENLNNV